MFRVLTVVAALVATPLAVSAAQQRDQCDKPVNPGKSGASQGQAQDAHARNAARKCPPAPVPPPADTQPTPPPPSAVGELWGQVFQDADSNLMWSWGDFALGGVTVDLFGPVTRSMVSDPQGNYAFTQLPAGTYTVCVHVPWPDPALVAQTVPFGGSLCSSGLLGYSRTLPEGQAIRFIGLDFGLAPHPPQFEQP